MSSISTSSFSGRKKLESSHFKQKNAIVDFKVSDKEEDNEDIRDEMDDIVEGYVEHSSNYSDTLDSSWFYSKNKATNFNGDVAITNAFKSFQYKVKLFRNTVAQLALNLTN